jgi:hypothetical protein
MKDTGVWTAQEAKTQHAFSERLANILSNNLKGLVYDVGCGRGDYVNHFNQKGISCIGIEGTDFNNGNMVWDLTNPLSSELTKGAVICLEVAEHIPQKYESIFLDNLQLLTSKYLFMSWAIKGQGGHGHVNEQDKDYVLKTMNARGFKLNSGATNQIRNAMVGDKCWWFAQSMYVFEL